MLLTSPLSSPLKNPIKDGFSPAGGSPSLTAKVQALFAGGKVGGMWDMGDTATLFQNSPGDPSFSPVTSAGQQIGTTLDKSKKSAWTDNTGSTWVKTAGDGVVTVVGNTVTITGATTTTTVDRVGGSIPFVPGIAVMNYSVSWVTAGIIRVYVRGINLGAPVNGAIAELPASLNLSAVDRLYLDSGTATFTINSFKYWEGNHATQHTAGSRPLYQVDGGYGCAQFDGIDDALLFPAITFGGAFNTFVAGKVTSGTQGVHLWRTADVNGTWAKYKSGDATAPTGTGSGSPTYAVNGTALSPSQQGQLYTQINGVDCVVESIGVVLTAETALQLSGFVGSLFTGNAHRVLMISGTLTAGEKLLCRQWCAQGNGVTVV